MKGDEVVTERGAGPAQPELQPADLRDPSVDAPHGLDEIRIPQDRELWTSLEAAAHLRFDTLHAFYSWVCRHKVPREYRGKEALYRKADLDAALRRDPRRVVAPRNLLSHNRRTA
jgi:hypothetical protein